MVFSLTLLSLYSETPEAVKQLELYKLCKAPGCLSTDLSRSWWRCWDTCRYVLNHIRLMLFIFFQCDVVPWLLQRQGGGLVAWNTGILPYFSLCRSSHTGCDLHHHAVLSVELGAGGGHGHVLQLDYKCRYSRISVIYTNYLLPGLSKSAYRSGPAKVSTLIRCNPPCLLFRAVSKSFVN